MDRKISDFYTDLVVISQQAFDRGCFDIAFDALSGAMHAADTLLDRLRLQHIHSIATNRAFKPSIRPMDAGSFQSNRGHGGPHSYVGLIRSVENSLDRLRRGTSKQDVHRR